MYFVFSYKGHHLQPSDSPLHYLRWENVIGTFELVFTTGPFNCTQVALSCLVLGEIDTVSETVLDLVVKL